MSAEFFGTRTERIVQPLHVRRRGGQLLLIAHCALRNDQRTFKLDQVVRMAQMDMPPLVMPPKVKKHGGARIYDDGRQECPADQSGAMSYDPPAPIKLVLLTNQLDLPIPPVEQEPPVAVDLTITPDPS
jgi:hypothetical protein